MGRLRLLDTDGLSDSSSHNVLRVWTASDLLAVTGAVTLHGYLAAHHVGTDRPALGATFRVVSGAGIAYSASVSSSGTTGGLWAPAHTGTGIYLVRRPL